MREPTKLYLDLMPQEYIKDIFMGSKASPLMALIINRANTSIALSISLGFIAAAFLN